MKGVTFLKRFGCTLLVLFMLLPLFTACSNTSKTGNGEYDHLKERYVYYRDMMFILMMPDEPGAEFATASKALRGTEIPLSYDMFQALAEQIGEDTPEARLQKAHCLNAMGISKTITSEFLEAEACYKQAEAIYLELEGEESISVALCRLNWAISLYEQNQYEQAGEEIGSVAWQLEQLLPENHPDLAVCYLFLGMNFVKLEDYKKAGEYSSKAYQIAEELYGTEDLITLMCNSGNMVVLRYAQGDKSSVKKVRNFYEKQYVQSIKILGEDHPSVGLALEGMASCDMQLGNYSNKTLAYLEEAEAILISAYNNRNKSLFGIYYNIGEYYLLNQNYDDALGPYAKCVWIIEGIIVEGQESWQYAYALGDIGNVYIYMIKPEKAIPYCLKRYYILTNYEDHASVAAGTKNTLQKAYDYCNYSDEPFEEWLEVQMELQAGLIGKPLPVEGYEYLYQ